MTLKGQLQHFGLGEVFQALALSRHTGSLVVQRGREKKTIYFSEGSVSLVSTGKSIRLGEILVRERKITEEQVQAAIEEQRTSGKLVGRILVDQGLIHEADVENALKKKIEEELHELFLWETGTFEFLPEYSPPELLDPLARHTQISIDPQAVLMEGLRQLDEWRIIQGKLPDVRAVVRKQAMAMPETTQLDLAAIHLFNHLPDQASVAEILEDSLETRFRTLRLLYEFAEEGLISLLGPADCLEMARGLAKSGRPQEAQELYLFLLETTEFAKDLTFVEECGIFLLDVGERNRGADTLERCMAGLQTEDRNDDAWRVGMVLFERGTPSLDLLQLLWMSRKSGTERQVRKVRDALVERLSKQQRDLNLVELIGVSPDEFAEPFIMITHANALARLDREAEAIEVLESATNVAADRDEIEAQIACARQILVLQPERSDIKRRLQSLVNKKDEKDKRRRQRLTILGGVVGVLLLLSIIPIRYEMKARESFQRARMFQVAYSDSTEYTKIVNAYREVVQQYPLSTPAWKAREEIDRLLAKQEAQTNDVLARQQGELDEAEAARARLEAEYKTLLGDRETALESRDLREARRISEKLLSDYEPLVEKERVPFPLEIRSKPPGADLTIDGNLVGQTPYTHFFEPGATIEIGLELAGYDPSAFTFHDQGDVAIEIRLRRGAIAEWALDAAVDGESVAIDGLVAVPCRNGVIYAFDPSVDGSKRLRWKKKVGILGHPSPMLAGFGGYLLAGSTAGQVVLIEAQTGETVWEFSDLAPMTAPPVVSADGQWIAFGNESGKLIVLKALTGDPLGFARFDYPVERIGFDANGGVFGIDRARRLRTFSIPDLNERSTSILPARAVAWLPKGGIFTADGTLVGEARSAAPAPTTRVRTDRSTAAYGSSDEWVRIESGVVTTGPSHGALSSPPVFVGEYVYLPGADGNLRCCEVESGRQLWTFELGDTVVAALPLGTEEMFIVLSRGRVLLIEGQTE